MSPTPPENGGQSTLIDRLPGLMTWRVVSLSAIRALESPLARLGMVDDGYSPTKEPTMASTWSRNLR